MDDIQGGGQLSSQGQYISCMKINGVPLLPPLMTEECRNEMKYYKQLALAVERRISDLNVCLDDSTLYSTNTTTNLPSDTEECFDQTNMSYDYPHDRSSFSFIGDQLTTDLSEPKPDELFESNDFESMNSQVTIIDMSSEHKNEKQIPKLDRKENKPQKKIDDAVKIRDTADGSVDSINPKLWSVGKIHTGNNSPSLESPSSESVTKKDDPFTKSPYLMRTPSKDNVLGSSSAKNMKTTPTNNPLKRKKITPMKKENISPAVVGKKPIPKGRSPYELPKVTKKTVIQPHKLSPAKNITGSLNNISSGLTSPPKLVRQNSYTLESPSPLLLAHLEVQSITSGIDVGSISMSESTSRLCNVLKNRSADKSLDLNTSIGSDINSLSLGEVSLHIDETPKRNRSKICDMNVTPVNSSENKVPNLSNTENLKNNASSSSSTNMRKICNELFKETETIKHNALEHSASSQYPPTESNATSLKDNSLYGESEVVQNEFENKIVSNGIEILSDLQSISSKDSPKVYFDFIMRKFKEDHEKQMNALIKKQQDEQLILKKSFETQQKVFLDQFQTALNGPNQASKKRHSSQAISAPTKRSEEEDTYVPKHKTLHSLQKDNSQHSSDTSCSDSMEKYLTISADVLNTSRCLLINRKTVNLSPTDIQCVNVMPRQASIPCIMGDGEPSSHTDRISAARVKDAATKKYNKIASMDDARTDPNSMYLRRTNNDSYFDANRSFQGYDEMALDESLDTARTNNTLDDLNFSFASDDGAHTNKLYTDGNRNEYFANSNNSNGDYEKASKLKNARSKISEIQKNLASQTLSMTRSLHSDNHYLEGDGHLSASDQAVSLSSIDVMSDYYTRNYADRNHLSLNLTEINKPSGKQPPLKRKYKSPEELQREIKASTVIVAYCRGYLTRRLMKTERVETTVQTIRDALLCALQLHRDEGGIQGADVDLHRRLIQQITAACYTLHDIFILSRPEEQMALIRQDRERKAHRAASSNLSPHHRQLSATTQRFIKRKLEGMSRSHSGVFTSRSSRSSTHYPPNVMSRSHYESGDHMRATSSDKGRRTLTVSGDLNPRKPWR